MDNDKILYPSHFDIEYFRNFRNVSFDLGRRITVISGQNGVGKSNLLSLISSASGLNKKSDLGSNFQPDFNEFFKIDESENFGEYKLFLTYSENDKPVLKKRLSFKNDTRFERGIRIIPRTAPLDDSVSTNDAKKIGIEVYGVGADGRVKIPTIYLSLSRLYPLGEHKDKVKIRNVREKSYFLKNDICDKYRTWYNTVIPNSIKEEASFTLINKEACDRASLYMNMTNTPVLSQSIGQDNLGNIISALVDIYNLSLQEDYKGALLCIDEIDVSLHPDSQIRLFNLLVELSENMNMQLVLSTHSLTILEQIKKKETESNVDFKLVYLKSPTLPCVTQRKDFFLLKADMFGKTEVEPPRVSIYFEDKVGQKLFNLLLETFRKIYTLVDGKSKEGVLKKSESVPDFCLLNKRILKLSDVYTMEENIKEIPIELGCDTLFNLDKYDSYFKRTIIILDGDARIKSPKLQPKIKDYLDRPFILDNATEREHDSNIIFLPDFFAPESFLFRIIRKMYVYSIDNNSFWNELDNNRDTMLYTPEKISAMFAELTGEYTNKNIKSIFKSINNSEVWNFIDRSDLLFYYYSNYETVAEIIDFFEFIHVAYKEAYNLILDM